MVGARMRVSLRLAAGGLLLGILLVASAARAGAMSPEDAVSSSEEPVGGPSSLDTRRET